MPVYTYTCKTCGASFRRTVDPGDELKSILCPICGSRDVERLP